VLVGLETKLRYSNTQPAPQPRATREQALFPARDLAERPFERKVYRSFRIPSDPAKPAASTETGAFASELARDAARWLADAHTLPAEVIDDLLAVPQSNGEAPQGKLLVADDNADLRDYLKRLLSPRWDVELAADAEYDTPPAHVTIRADYRRDDRPSLVGTYPIASFEMSEDFIHGRSVVVGDTLTSALFSEALRAQWTPLGVRSLVAVSIVKGGILIAALGVADTVPRDLSDVVAWIEETADHLMSKNAQYGT
jgi:GAF domain-containing protein